MTPFLGRNDTVEFKPKLFFFFLIDGLLFGNEDRYRHDKSWHTNRYSQHTLIKALPWVKKGSDAKQAKMVRLVCVHSLALGGGAVAPKRDRKARRDV